MFQIHRVQDITLNELELRKRYYDNFLKGNLTESENILKNNSQLDNKVLGKDNLNRLVDSIISLENEYFNNTDKVLNSDLNKYQLSIDNFLYIGNFDVLLQYKIGNFVIYERELYFCYKTPPLGINPTNGNYWIYLGLMGESGYPYLGAKYVGLWNEESAYEKYDMVSYENKLFVSKLQNINSNPITDSVAWFPIMNIHPTGMVVSKIEPENLSFGKIWLQEIGG